MVDSLSKNFNPLPPQACPLKVPVDPKIDSKFSHLKQCLKSLAYAPTTPDYPKSLFKNIGNEEIFATHCYLDDGDQFESFMFLTDSGVKALKFPVYKFMVGIDHTSLPGDITHFKYDNKDYYVNPSYGDARILTYDKVPVLAEELMKSMDKVNRSIKKYEDYLKSVNKISEINIKSDPIAVESVMPCLEKNQRETVKTYMYGKFKDTIPAMGTIVDDYNQFNKVREEAKQKYSRPFEDLRNEIQKDLFASHPVCKGVIDEKMIAEVFEKSWGENGVRYELLRKRYFP